jgi:hypothetical protein
VEVPEKTAPLQILLLKSSQNLPSRKLSGGRA